VVVEQCNQPPKAFKSLSLQMPILLQALEAFKTNPLGVEEFFEANNKS